MSWKSVPSCLAGVLLSSFAANGDVAVVSVSHADPSACCLTVSTGQYLLGIPRKSNSISEGKPNRIPG